MLGKAIFGIVFFVCSWFSNANEPGLNERFKLVEVASGSFVQHKHFKVLNHPIESRGEFYFDHKLGMIWKTTFPVTSTMLMKKGGLFITDRFNNTKKLPAAMPVAKIREQVLSGNIAAIKKEFNVKGSFDNVCMILEPKGSVLSQVFNKIELCGQQALERLVLHENAGNRTEISVLLQEVEKLPEVVSAQLQ